jgi:hypothetical protein
VVVTVSAADVPEFTEPGLIEHCGASCGFGDTEQVRASEPLKPAIAVTPMVEVADCPGLTVPGVSSETESAKSGVRSKMAVSVWLEVSLRLQASVPEQPHPFQAMKFEPGWAIADRVTALKNTKLPGWDGAVLGIGFQFFNLFNHPNFGLPTHNISDSIFGQVAEWNSRRQASLAQHAEGLLP